MVIICGAMNTHPVIEILERWPNRAAVLEDARSMGAELAPVAVHRWFQRQHVPSRYWAALLAGAKRRKIKLKAEELAYAHALYTDQVGHLQGAGK
jgi:hypothetical protein